VDGGTDFGDIRSVVGSTMMKWYLQRLKNVYHWLVSAAMVVKYGYPAKKLVVVGVTGTDGKTTTCTLIYEILKAAGLRVALISTVEARIGDEVIDTGLHTTNPDARMLQKLLRQMVDAGVTHVVLEVTAHGLDQYRVLGCNFKIGVLTNITHEHMDDFVTMERYRDTKAKLLFATQYSVLNKDDSSFEYMKNKIQNSRFPAKRDPASRDKVQLIPYTKTTIKEISPVLSGDYNLYNISAATEVAKILKVQDLIINKVIKNFEGVRGRREEVRVGQNFKVIVDFAHTPNALEQLLKSFPGRKILVFGCTGERDKTKRPMMGEIAARMADTVIITSDDTRMEDQDEINKQILAGVKNRGGVLVENDRRKAIEMALKMAKPGDTVILAGKGHEKTILIGKEERPWSDQEVAREILQKMLQ
jgi:UDP-N-acetylmuramoyl-L-alanyl-D-glutamate--2,6-diaminopimelate ligase